MRSGPNGAPMSDAARPLENLSVRNIRYFSKELNSKCLKNDAGDEGKLGAPGRHAHADDGERIACDVAQRSRCGHWHVAVGDRPDASLLSPRGSGLCACAPVRLC